MSGYVRAQRARFSHHLFAREKFCRGYAWDWMIAQARFTDKQVSIGGKTILLRRGQFSHSIRFMAEAWNWDKAAVSRFISRLKTETMIETGTETGQIIVTICNYDEYQADAAQAETDTEAASETAARQQRDSSETKKNNDEIRKEGSSLRAAKRANPKTRISPEAEISPEQITIAAERGLTPAEARAQFVRFRDWAVAKGQTYASWDAAWRNWITSPHFKPISKPVPAGGGEWTSMGFIPEGAH